MDRAITDEILEELSSTLQRVEAQSSAILEFVKEKGIVKEDELDPYLERANAASSVRWRATRVRLEKLVSGLENKQEQKEQQKQTQEEERTEVGHKKEQAKEEVPKSEADKPAKTKAAGERGKIEAEMPHSSGEEQEPSQPKQAAHAVSGDSKGSHEHTLGEGTASEDQPPAKPERPKAA